MPQKTIAYDQVHEWELIGTSAHPFHIHLYHMQVVTPGGCGAHEEGEFYDTISSEERCTVRFKTADIGQRCVLHCHVLFHEDNGSMAWVNVTGPNMPRNDVKSPAYQCAAIAANPPPPAPTPAPVMKPTSAPVVDWTPYPTIIIEGWNDGTFSAAAAAASKWFSLMAAVLVLVNWA